MYTLRTAGMHFEAGNSHGDDSLETEGFVVRLFDRGPVEQLAEGFELMEVWFTEVPPSPLPGDASLPG